VQRDGFEMKKRVLFICTGNVCRSPMAEGLFQQMVDDAGSDIEVTSAGISAFDGSTPSRNSVTVMKEEGIDISHQRSTQLRPDIVGECTHIFGMAQHHCEAVIAYFPEAVEKTFILRELIVDKSLDLEVPDPIGGEEEEYRLTRNLIKEALPSILQFVTTGTPDE